MWAPLVGSNWLYELSAQQRAHRANWVPRERSATHRPQTRHLAKMAPLEPFVEAGELRLREKDHANVTVTRTCSINSLTVRQSLDWPLWSGHFPTSSASAGRKGSSGLLVGRAEARAVYVPRTKLPLAPTKRRACDSGLRASRGREQRDTRPRPAMNPRSPKVKHLRPMVVPPLFRTFRRENPDFSRTYTICSTTATNCFQPRYLELREAGRPRRWLVVSSTHRAEVS